MRKAFTLVELLIVIAIIAILAAIAIPQYTKYVKKSAAASAEATLSNCLTAAMAQFADNGTKTTYPCKVPDGKGGSQTVKIKLDSDGNLKGFLSGNTTSSNATTTITIKIKEHEVNCTAHTDTNTITCQ